MNSGHGLDRIASTGVDMARRRGTLKSNRKIGIKDKRRRIKKNKYKKIVVSSWSGGSFVTQKERTDHPVVIA